MALTSELFKNNRKLQDCLIRDAAHIVANEPPFRRGVNNQGEHVALIHRALRQVMPNPSFGLEEATETYGPKTAEVVRQFKAAQNPPILNKALRQTVPDNIVGKQTIAALDELVGRKKPSPPPVAPPVIPVKTEQRLVAKKTFEKQLVQQLGDDHANDSGSGGFTIATAAIDLVKNTLRIQKNPIEGGDFDDGVVQSRQTISVPSAQIMKTVNIDREVRVLPSTVVFGGITRRFDITRTYRYSYGVGLPTELVRVSTTTTIIDLRGGRSVVRDTRTARQPSNFSDPR